jgi:serine/threonine-protein kinase
VKLMMKELAANQEALARFRREAEVTSHLGHPHIVNVFDFGTTPAGASYLVMEYLEGEDLDHRLRRTGQQPLAGTVHIVKQVASALAATHAKGVVHRDLKPANLFVLEVEGETDFVKVVDFGISKVRAATTKLTGASAVMGTPNYMSPEQARGQIDDIDHRTDQWSLACIAYEMLTGRGPFVGESAASLLYQVIHEEPPPIAKRAPGLPADVEKVIRRGLAKRMEDRYPSITAFSRALELACTAATTPIDPPSERREARRTKPLEPHGRQNPPQPTTFSNTASEMVSYETAGIPRQARRLFVAGSSAAGLLALTLILLFRSGSRNPPPAGSPDVSTSTAPPRAQPAPVAVPAVPAPTPAAAPPSIAAPPPPPVHAKEETPAVPIPATPRKSTHASRTPSPEKPSAPSKPATAAPQPNKVTKPGWVDPFEQEEGKAGAADPSTKHPAKPKRRLIEDL